MTQPGSHLLSWLVSHPNPFSFPFAVLADLKALPAAIKTGSRLPQSHMRDLTARLAEGNGEEATSRILREETETGRDLGGRRDREKRKEDKRGREEGQREDVKRR